MPKNQESKIVIYQTEDGQTRLNVHFENKNAWLTQDQMAVLFAKSKSTINEHINNIYAEKELVLDKSNTKKGGKSKILYHIDGHAGMHSQKIGNALRTVDTWYPEYEDAEIGPIAAEPYGAVTNLGKAYRPLEKEKDKRKDIFTLFDQFACGTPLETNDEHYVMAVLVRGGVFGESGKE